MTPERHTFTPSRPGGTVCVVLRDHGTDDLGNWKEHCGYPASHPIHGPLQLDLSPQPAPAPTGAQLRDDLDKLQALVDVYGDERERAGAAHERHADSKPLSAASARSHRRQIDMAIKRIADRYAPAATA